MASSVLNDTKKVLGLDASYAAFDLDITLHINSVFLTLQQLGVGPTEGFMIEDADTTWDEFTRGDLPLNAVKTYVYVRVRLLFDPPNTSFAIQNLQDQAKELEWRLNHHAEVGPVGPPTPPVVTQPVIDLADSFQQAVTDDDSLVLFYEDSKTDDTPIPNSPLTDLYNNAKGT